MVAETKSKPWYEMGLGLRARFRPLYRMLRYLPSKYAVGPYIDWIAHKRQNEIDRTLRDFDLILSKLNDQSIVVDCGANVGNVTAKLAATGAQVHSFEPEPYLFSFLQDRFANTPNVILYHAAVASQAGKLQLWLEVDPSRQLSDLQGHSLLRREGSSSDSQNVEVECVDFFQFLESLGKIPDLVKMDIEGAEVDILERLLTEDRAKAVGPMFVETHENQIPEVRERVVHIFRQVKARKLDRINLLWP